MPDPLVSRLRVRVAGIVQGVGFRPFVWREATARGLAGWVGNDAAGVVLEVEGAPGAVAAFLDALQRPPPLARVDQVRVEPLDPVAESGFEIRDSATGGSKQALISPDTATCPDCRRELQDPRDRRYRHPFVNCTSCGPRYTIVRDVPYDRSRTTMANFPLCAACQAEYVDPTDRRFHAEPVCCPECGPTLRLLDAAGREETGEPIPRAGALLRAGGILAVKGLGGYHLAVHAHSEEAVARLRRRKHREDRPFALMVLDVPEAEKLCHVDPQELALLTDAAAPIVLLARRAPASVAAAVAPGSPSLGLMLAYSPMHVLLLEAAGSPLVMTSGNRSDEPIAFDDADALSRLAPIADAFLVHDRPIRTRVDDSVCKVVRGRVVPIRRSRGHVPRPVPLPQEPRQPVLACGAALKNTFCLTRGRHAFVSHHVGDLDEYSTMCSYLDGIEHLTRLLDVEPGIVAHDLHPDYPSTRYALERPDVELVAVQHHHAHIASCLVDNETAGPVLGVAFDGLGLGPDGSAWGGEFLLADLAGYTRVAHLSTVALPGGDAAARQPWRMAAAHLDAAYEGRPPAGLAVQQRAGRRWEQVLAAAHAGVNAPPTSSAGRLFDAVSALLGVRDVVTYEGQAAIELEHLADPAETGSYDVALEVGPVLQVDSGSLIRAVTEDTLAGVATPVIAARFHNALADVVTQVCVRLRDDSGVGTVALSGGVFQNSLLLSRCLDRLEAADLAVLTHRQVPPNDGGVSLGQAAVAAARAAASE